MLHGAFAEGPLADDRRAMVILQAGGDDFARARAVLIHQHDQRNIGEPPVAGGVDIPRESSSSRPRVETIASPCLEEQIADAAGGGEQSAGIVAEIENQALHLLLGERLQRPLQFRGRIDGEIGDAE